jgi:uncharacterized membrane protein
MDKVLMGVGGLLLVVVVAFVLALFTGFTVSVLWGWFIVPLGMAQIGFAHAYGISLLGSVMMSTRGINMAGDGTNGWTTAAVGIVINLLALLLGWVTVGFM